MPTLDWLVNPPEHQTRLGYPRRFFLNLQNAHLTDLHRHDPTFNQYARRLLESVAREVNKSYRTYFKHPDVGPTPQVPTRTARSRYPSPASSTSR